jgi:Pyridoxamine 5'-phosphate oxidase
MAFFTAISPQQCDFIAAQAVYFVASAPSAGRVNLSPKGMDSFRVLGPNRVAYLDLTGSGNETAAHIRDNGRVTVMFCSFGEKPLILRLYGQGQVHHPGTPGWAELEALYPPLLGSRQIIEITVEQVQTSCGFAVPRMELVAERPTLVEWAAKKGEQGLLDYRRDKNRRSIDDLPTGLPE